MDFNKSVFVLGASLAVSAGANAAILGYSGVQSYMTKVVSGVTRTYSAIDVFVDCTNAADYIVNYYGVTTGTPPKVSFVGTVLNGVANSSTATNASATNGVLFNQGTGNSASWKPNYANADGLYDSFVTIGGRTQEVAADPDNGNALAGDPSFKNFEASTTGFGTLRTGTTATTNAGPGWYSADPNNLMNKAGSYADLKIMLGHFVVDVTNYLGTTGGAFTNTLTLRFNGNITIKVNGTTQQQPNFANSFNFLTPIPAPGAVALIGLAALVSRRRAR